MDLFELWFRKLVILPQSVCLCVWLIPDKCVRIYCLQCCVVIFLTSVKLRVLTTPSVTDLVILRVFLSKKTFFSPILLQRLYFSFFSSSGVFQRNFSVYSGNIHKLI